MIETLLKVLTAITVACLLFDMVLSWVIVPLLRIMGRAWRGDL